MLDAHVHLSDPFYGRDMGHTRTCMERLDMYACCVSTNIEDSKKTLELAKTNRRILPFVGMHPEFAAGDIDGMLDMIGRYGDNIAGIGEIGLDPAYGGEQLRALEGQLEAASKLDLCVSIHSRNSLDEVLDVVRSYSLRVLLHWFDGSKKQLAKAMDLGYFVSFGPLLVYANDKRALLRRADPSRVLAETDGPVSFSRCFEGRPAHISLIPSVIFCMAQVLNMSYPEMLSALDSNARSYLGANVRMPPT